MRTFFHVASLECISIGGEFPRAFTCTSDYSESIASIGRRFRADLSMTHFLRHVGGGPHGGIISMTYLLGSYFSPRSYFLFFCNFFGFFFCIRAMLVIF